ncbi:MAG: hypothetical protein R3B47_19050 [Bacteroidia bacterium]
MLYRSGRKSSHIPARTSAGGGCFGAGDTTIAVATLALCAGASLAEATVLVSGRQLACDMAGMGLCGYGDVKSSGANTHSSSGS